MKKAALILAIVMFLSVIPFSSVSQATDDNLLFELTEDEVDSFLADPEGHKFLRPAASGGRPVYSKDPDGGIKMTNRNADWQSVDIRDDWMERGKTYSVIAEFTAPSNTLFRFMNTDSPYATLAATGTEATSGTVALDIAIMDGQRGIRLTTPQSYTGDYTISSIQIFEGELPADAITEVWQMDIPSLHESFKDFFLVGNILEPGELSNTNRTEMFLHQYNIVTAENSMKPGSIWPTKNSYNFDAADRLVDWALDNGIAVHGHTLVWHSQSAAWLTSASDGTPLTRAEAKANMELFISTYVGHFAGRIRSWDVVNEAFQTSVGSNARTWQEALRKGGNTNENSAWFAAYENGADKDAGESGADYVYDAFVFARLADPNAILYYNDFNEEYMHKREAMASMVEELNELWKDDPRNTEPGRLLIEVIGMQAHYWTAALSVDTVRASIERFIETGARVAITELDIPLGSWQDFGQANETSLDRQGRLYADLFRLYVEFSNHIDRVSIWGKADHQSWRWQGHPVLFDGNFQAKTAFWQILEILDDVVAPTPLPATPTPNPATPPPETPEPAPTPAPDVNESERDFPWIIVIIGVIAVIATPLLIVFLRKKKLV